MGNSKPVDALFKDLGVPATDRNTLRQDVLTYISHFTGSEKKTCKLPRASIRDHIVAFVDAEEGREWFKRSSNGDVWSHSRSRVEVNAALTELAIKWLKSYRAALKRKDGSSMNNKKTTFTGYATSNGVNRSPRTSTSSTAFKAVNTEHSSLDDEYHNQTFEYTDEETDPSPDLLNKDDDDESLMDIIEVLNTPVKVPVKQSIISTSKTAAGEFEEATTTPRRNLESSLPTTPITVERSVPAQPASRSLLSPPATGTKRQAEDIGLMGNSLHDNLENREGVMQKRVRLASDSMSPQPIIREPQSAIQDTIVPFNDVPPIPIIQPAASSTVDNESDRTLKEPALVTVTLSNTASVQQRATYSLDSLRDVPAMVLDYVGQCRQSSLAKANAVGLAPLERKQCQERCRLFRDLYADIESRILNLKYEPTEEERKVDSEEEAGKHERKVEVSSFCLWD